MLTPAPQALAEDADILVDAYLQSAWNVVGHRWHALLKDNTPEKARHLIWEACQANPEAATQTYNVANAIAHYVMWTFPYTCTND